jgi:hypothetical protein
MAAEEPSMTAVGFLRKSSTLNSTVFKLPSSDRLDLHLVLSPAET